MHLVPTILMQFKFLFLVELAYLECNEQVHLASKIMYN